MVALTDEINEQSKSIYRYYLQTGDLITPAESHGRFEPYWGVVILTRSTYETPKCIGLFHLMTVQGKDDNTHPGEFILHQIL